MKTIGILGAGQLGRMLLQASINYPITTMLLDDNENAPAAHLAHTFIKGSITNFDDVYNFGKKVDVLTIEIENVNIEALEKLENEGLVIVPNVNALKTIKNKILQKAFYTLNEIPTAKYETVTAHQSFDSIQLQIPFIYKLAEGGYDGYGVFKIESKEEWEKVNEHNGIVEECIEIEKEIAVIVAIDGNKNIAMYSPIEMIFNKQLHQLDYQICPAQLEENILWKIEAIAQKIARNFESKGLFAIEFLIDRNNQVLVNETAPRVHNSGHHTIETSISSQFDMLLRILMEWPLGNTKLTSKSAMINIIGEPNYKGIATYIGLDEILKIDNAHVHIYDKKETKPGRKMGHVTVKSDSTTDLHYFAKQIKNTLKVISTNNENN